MWTIFATTKNEKASFLGLFGTDQKGPFITVLAPLEMRDTDLINKTLDISLIDKHTINGVDYHSAKDIN